MAFRFLMAGVLAVCASLGVIGYASPKAVDEPAPLLSAER